MPRRRPLPHANGRAIDINPRENPWIQPRTGAREPDAYWTGSRRTLANEKYGLVVPGGTVHRVFTELGWSWAGLSRSRTRCTGTPDTRAGLARVDRPTVITPVSAGTTFCGLRHRIRRRDGAAPSDRAQSGGRLPSTSSGGLDDDRDGRVPEKPGSTGAVLGRELGHSRIRRERRSGSTSRSHPPTAWEMHDSRPAPAGHPERHRRPRPRRQTDHVWPSPRRPPVRSCPRRCVGLAVPAARAAASLSASRSHLASERPVEGRVEQVRILQHRDVRPPDHPEA